MKEEKIGIRPVSNIEMAMFNFNHTPKPLLLNEEEKKIWEEDVDSDFDDIFKTELEKLRRK